MVKNKIGDLMTKLNKTYIIIFIIAVILILLAIFIKIQPSNNTLTNTNIDDSPYELRLVNDDLLTYGHSAHIRKIILEAIEQTSKEYKLPIGLMHAIFRVESDYRFMITHPTVNVVAKGKSITTNAVGLGGVMWVFWGDSLKAHKIAETEMDLYLPDVSIKASGYILRYLINDEMSKHSQSEYTILDNVIRRYYGAYSDTYLNKMERVTSDLWMKRIAKEIIQTKRIKQIPNEHNADDNIKLSQILNINN